MAEAKPCSRCGQPLEDSALHCPSCGHIFWWSTLGMILGCYLVGTICLLITINTSSLGWRIAGIVVGWFCLLAVFGVLADTLARSEMIRSRNQGDGAAKTRSVRARCLSAGTGLLGLALVFGSIEGSRLYAEWEKQEAEIQKKREETLAALLDATRTLVGVPAIAAAPVAPGLVGKDSPQSREAVKLALQELAKAIPDLKFQDREKTILRLTAFVDWLETGILSKAKGCPPDFAQAFADHAAAWKAFFEYMKRNPDQVFRAEGEEANPQAAALFTKAVTRMQILASVAASYGFDLDGNEKDK